MATALRTVVLGTRTSCETKARFAALAAQQGLSESAMLGLLVERALLANGALEAADQIELDTQAERANDRVTLRLRPGDRALADAKAATRRMKTSSYLAMLVRAHVRSSAVMPPAELEELRCMAGHLAAMGRQLRATSMPVSSELLIDVGTAVESVREAVSGVVRRNLISWEAGNA
ncbi:hypothetical protein [Variovorax rhizosphaerae]|uniref:Ribbon-helix-helix protein, CopG family n=1 Tax=Variovorax rhizosphaerae TaxID=1836200 RepID=A0ABU8WY86_9BURK